MEPKYFNNYFSTPAANGGAFFPDPNLRIYDFGSSKDGNQMNNQNQGLTSTQQTDILESIRNARGNNAPIYETDYPWPLRQWQHLLTGWHQNQAVEFSMDPGRFGRCDVEVTNQSYPNPGNCIKGGRTGYSVKNVSRDYLRSSEHQLNGSEAGPILNPPSF